MYDKYSSLITAEMQDTKKLIEKGQKLFESTMGTIKTTMDTYAGQYGYTYQQLSDMFNGTSFTGFKNVLTGKLDSIITNTAPTATPTPADNTGGGEENPSDTPRSEDVSAMLVQRGPLNGNNSIVADPGLAITPEELVSSVNKKIDDIEKWAVGKLQKTSTKKKDMTSEVNKVITSKYSGKILSNDNQKALAKKLGVSDKDYNKKSGALYKKLKELKILGFSKGGVVSIDNIEKQIKANGDSVIASANPGERILTPLQNDLFEKFVGNLPQLNQMTDTIKPLVDLPKMPDIQPVERNSNVEFNATLSFPNATKVDEKVVEAAMLKAVQTPSSSVRKAIVDNTIGQMNRTSRLGSNKYRA